jgi:predicted CXXCH cytochrome family protein
MARSLLETTGKVLAARLSVARNAMKLPDRRYLAWSAGLAVTAALPIFAGLTNVGWEFSEVLGFAGTLACLALCACPVRPRESTPAVLLPLRRHEVLGWIALTAAALHIVMAVASDHTVIDYLKPTSPLYQLAGISAFVLLLVLVASSAANSRRRLWRSHRGFQATHIVFGCLLTVLVAAHVVTAGRYTGGYGRRIVFVSVAAGGIAMLLRRRRGLGTALHRTTLIRRLAFGRHSTLIFSAIAVTILALSTLIASRAGLALREPVLRRAQALPLNFDHGKHTPVNCLSCHHNYADGRGFDACIHCHRSARADLKVGVEARFHGFCFNCHRNPEPQFRNHGPVSGCESCHSEGSYSKISPLASDTPVNAKMKAQWPTKSVVVRSSRADMNVLNAFARSAVAAAVSMPPCHHFGGRCPKSWCGNRVASTSGGLPTSHANAACSRTSCMILTGTL